MSWATRALVRLDLQLQIGSGFAWLKTGREWNTLPEEIGATLLDVQAHQV
ncbi:hypothetical protein [Deinococcus hopiensis]|nr:hypothetical protein [Deinococcus hopiensis]